MRNMSHVNLMHIGMCQDHIESQGNASLDSNLRRACPLPHTCLNIPTLYSFYLLCERLFSYILHTTGPFGPCMSTARVPIHPCACPLCPYPPFAHDLYLFHVLNLPAFTSSALQLSWGARFVKTHGEEMVSAAVRLLACL